MCNTFGRRACVRYCTGSKRVGGGEPTFRRPPIAVNRLRLREHEPLTTLTRAQFTDRISTPDFWPASSPAFSKRPKKGFKRDIGVVPRHFLRHLVDVMDQVEQNPDFDPEKNYKVQTPDPEPADPVENEGADEAW